MAISHFTSWYTQFSSIAVLVLSKYLATKAGPWLCTNRRRADFELLVHKGVSYNVYKELHSTVLGVLVRIMRENVHV